MANHSKRCHPRNRRGRGDDAQSGGTRCGPWGCAAGNQEVEKLIGEVEELIARLADTADPGIARIRARVAETLRTTRRAVTESATQVQKRQARGAMTAGDTYVREQPWEAIGVAAVMGLVIGFLVFRR